MKEIQRELINICLRAGKKLKMKINIKPLEDLESEKIGAEAEIEAKCVDKNEEG